MSKKTEAAKILLENGFSWEEINTLFGDNQINVYPAPYPVTYPVVVKSPWWAAPQNPLVVWTATNGVTPQIKDLTVHS
jgi:hypothetical protein